MSKYRRAAKIDANQPDIIKALRSLHGVEASPGHDDILVGYQGRTYWFEIKDPDKALSKKTGMIKDSEIKESQKDLLDNWSGHYAIVWTLDQILENIGYRHA